MDSGLPINSIVQDHVLIIPAVGANDGGTYRCVASNLVGTVYAQVVLIIEGLLFLLLSFISKYEECFQSFFFTQNKMLLVPEILRKNTVRVRIQPSTNEWTWPSQHVIYCTTGDIFMPPGFLG